MPPKFGTSGLRGLVVDLTEPLITQHVHAFLAACGQPKTVFVGHDLRASSPAIAQLVTDAVTKMGADVFACGDVPTPALAMASMEAGAAAIMVTGSHIPIDRNGLKFYTEHGEITKADEVKILNGLGTAVPGKNQSLGVVRRADPRPAYVARYRDAFGATALSGLSLGVFSHSAVGRDLMVETLRAMGAEVGELGRSDVFIPIDTEAVSGELRDQLAGWAAPYDAIVSTDADGDRPLVADADGQVVGGDVLGQITARFLGADCVVTPVSSNTGVEALGFNQVISTKIGSPYVIAGMQGQERCVGYEANGGFLLGFDTGALAPLATRDAMLPIIATLVAAKGEGVAALVATQPAHFTVSDRLENIPTPVSAQLVDDIDNDPSLLLGALGQTHIRTDHTDGVRLICKDAIIHLRPSGNAPELRLYVETDSADRSTELSRAGLNLLGVLAAQR